MKAGDRVKMSLMWIYDEAFGVVSKITRDDYVVIIWEGVNGEWHYTREQCDKIEIVNEGEST